MNNPNINKNLPYFKITFFILMILITFKYSYAKNLLEIKDKINDSYYSFDTLTHNNIIKLIYSTKINDAISNYYLSFEYHTLGKIVYNENQQLAMQYFDKSILYINSAIQKCELNNQNLLAEFYALLSSALGKKSSLSGFSSFYWGLKSQSAYEIAYNNDSTNFKVRLIGAIHLMHVPEFLGGDKKKAKKVLLNLLKSEYSNQNKFELNWAEKAEIYAYLAQLDILNGFKKSKYIEYALKLQPNYDFIKFDLKKQIN